MYTISVNKLYAFAINIYLTLNEIIYDVNVWIKDKIAENLLKIS